MHHVTHALSISLTHSMATMDTKQEVPSIIALGTGGSRGADKLKDVHDDYVQQYQRR